MKSDAPVSRVGREALREAPTHRMVSFEGSDTAARSASLDTHARRVVPGYFGQQAREHGWQRKRINGTTTPRGAGWGCSERLTGFRGSGGCRWRETQARNATLSVGAAGGCVAERRDVKGMSRFTAAVRHAQRSGARRADRLDGFYPHHITDVRPVKRCI